MVRTKSRKWKILVAVLLALVVAYWLIYAAPLPFVRDLWEDRASGWSDPLKLRHRMADGMLLTGLFIGKDRVDVIGTLGPPPETENFKDWDMVYPLGQERGFVTIDSEWLVLRLDSNGKVLEARLVRD